MQTPPPPPFNQQPPIHKAYLIQHQQPLATINIPAPQPQHQQQAYQPTTRNRAKRGRGPHSATESNQCWNQGDQTYYQQKRQHTGGYGGQLPGGPTLPWQKQKLKSIPERSYSNTMKMHNNLSYYYSFVYDVDHTGWQYYPITIKRTHIPNLCKDEAQTIAVASMKVQHKNLPDGSGVGKV